MFNEVEFIAHDDVVQPRSKIEREQIEGGVRLCEGGDGQQAASQPSSPSSQRTITRSIVALLGVLQIDVGSQLPQYGTMLASEAYEDKASHEVFIKPHYKNEEVFYAGHAQDPFCPFSHFESLTLEFLSYSVARIGHSRHSRSKYKHTSNSCPTRPKRTS
ncbi:hypothetical protein PRNP1_010100 [Phytophthora ramorum]